MPTPTRCAHEMPFGAELAGARCRFRLWAPASREVKLRLRGELLPLARNDAGWWRGEYPAAAGDAYSYLIDDARDVPDPAARAQADDVHGPSLVVDPRAYGWNDGAWRGRPWHEAVIYELHVGTFTPEGTFEGAAARLPELRDLGVTAVELMPIGDFPGARDWGYDGVLPFAPDRRYGTPEKLKSLIDAAHHCGLMVLLDVVYNHFGPEGNYLHLYAPEFFTTRHHTPWGAAIDFTRHTVRDFVIHNACYWVEEFRLDGLRLDAVHAIHDDSSADILEELGRSVRACADGRLVHLILENNANEVRYLRQGGGYDAQWNDDFHHALHVILTGEEGGYYQDFAQAPWVLLAHALSEGFAFQGQYSLYHQANRGENTRGLPLAAFVNFLQNHDQIGNRACGERLTRLTSPAALRAATVILLLAPSPPLLFMGQEWGSEQPFPFFCDFSGELGARVTEGRRREFARFLDFTEAASRARIPDPQARTTWELAVLRREARATPVGREWLELHRDLLRVRREHLVPHLAGAKVERAEAVVIGEAAIAARWRLDGMTLLLLANLGDEPVADVAGPNGAVIHATSGALAENGTLMGWGVVWYLAQGEAQIRFNGEAVLA